MTAYSLMVENNSSNRVDFCMFQTPPDLGRVDVNTLAWFVEPAYPTTTVNFQWDTSYSFVWSDAGPLSPGVRFTASQVWDADPMDSQLQAVRLFYGDGAYTFGRLAPSAARYAGSLYVEQGDDVPLRGGSVGIGMSGSGTFAVDSQPNQHLVFEPHPEYWLVAGSFERGQVLDVAQMSTALKIEYFGARTSMTVSLGMDNTLAIV
ncbi:hypothetical protein KGA66_28725 [Actinocrinis puniceicyclus]|uniref:Uncharacterized protein n=1 Tax=Actinocrinis puniceicyclus TaxID=977794 RepID=A0A8J7WW82_9ACTN|nr:hypothetical protein [Actinocrinis puniceicyclus]MBS2967052.1 hypothetical protein [Actinocrinis puniceicyclus]